MYRFSYTCAAPWHPAYGTRVEVLFVTPIIAFNSASRWIKDWFRVDPVLEQYQNGEWLQLRIPGQQQEAA